MLPASFSTAPCQDPPPQQPAGSLVGEVLESVTAESSASVSTMATNNGQDIQTNSENMAQENGERETVENDQINAVVIYNGTGANSLSSGANSLSSVNSMMSAVISTTNSAENGVNLVIKLPGKCTPNRIGRRNQESKEEKSSHMCPLCKKIFSSDHQLTTHLRQHNTVNGGTTVHSCSICCKSLSSPSSLDRHMLVHSGERPYKCSVCTQSFTTNGNMHRHMKIHEKDPNSSATASPPHPQKRKRFSSKRKASPEMEPAEDETPPAKMIIEESPQVQQVKKSEDLIPCPICFKEFPCKSSLDTHMETHPEASLKCDICCISFRTHRGLLRHNAEVHKLIPRDPSGKPFIQNNPSIPAGFNDLSFTEFSTKKFPFIAQKWCETNLRRNVSESHGSVCDICDKAFPMALALELHMKTHEESQVNNLDKPEKSDVKDPGKKAFMEALGLFGTKNINPVSQEDKSSDSQQVPQTQAMERELPHEIGSNTATLKLSPLGATSAEGPFSVVHSANENVKLLSLQPFQKGFMIQPDNSIVVKPISGELADIQQILKMATSAQSQISLPPLSRNSPGITKHMPPLKPKPPVTPRSVVAASTPPLFVTSSQASPGSISPSLPSPLRMLKNSMESATSAIFLHASCSSSTMNSHLPNSNLSKPALETKLAKDSIIKALMPLDLEAKNKQEVADGNLKSDSSESSSKKTIQNRKNVYPCEYCDQVFDFPGLLRAHKNTHLGKSPYQCKFCKYITADKAALKRHVRTHSGEKPYMCKSCGVSFSVKANCERHIRRTHLEINKNDIQENIIYVTTDTTELLDALCPPGTVCKICGEKITNYLALYTHMRDHYNSQKNILFKCKECGNAFLAKRTCNQHILKIHKNIEKKEIKNHILCNSFSPEENRSDTPPLEENTHQEGKPIPSHQEPQNGFLYGSGSSFPLKREPASSFPVNLDEPLDFSQKRKYPYMFPVKEEPVDTPLASFDCSMEPLDLSMPKRARLENDNPQTQPNTEEQMCGPISQVISCQQYQLPLSANAITHSKQMKNPVHFTFPLISPTVLGSTTILRPLRPKPPPLLPKPPVTKELPPLASIAQIISSVSTATALIKTDLKTSSSQVAANSTSTTEKPCASNSKMTIQKEPVSQTEDVAHNAASLTNPSDLSDPTDLVAGAKKRGRKKGTKNKPKVSISVDLESSGEFASVEKMLATTHTNKFSPYLQSTGHLKNTVDKNGTSEDEINSGEDKKGKRNSYSNSLQKISCDHPTCYRTFPWESSLRRHMLTHTGQKPYPCPKCTSSFSTKSNCERHLLRKHGVANLPSRRNGLMPQCKKNCHESRDSTDSQSDPDLSALEVLDLTSRQKVKTEQTSENNPAENLTEDKEPKQDGEEQLEDDAVSNKSLDLNFASKLIEFKLSASEQATSNSCNVCGKNFKFAATLDRHKRACVSKTQENNIEYEHNDAFVQACNSVLVTVVEQTSQAEELPVDLKVSKSDVVAGPSEVTPTEGEECSEEQIEKPMDSKPQTKGTKADKRKKICLVCNKRFWSRQDLTRHMRSHTGERPYKCETCERTFTLKHSLVRHKRIHQKIRDTESQGKESDKEMKGDEESDTESMQSSTNHMSENECDTAVPNSDTAPSQSPQMDTEESSLTNPAASVEDTPEDGIKNTDSQKTADPKNVEGSNKEPGKLQ